jgi:trigger factor
VNVSVESLGPCKKLLRVEVPVEQVNAAFDAVTGQFQKAVQLPGFRPGKAPKHLIVRTHEGRIVEEVRKKLVDESFRDAAKQENLRVVVTLDVEEQQFGRNQELKYTVTLETAPEFALPTYKGLKAERLLRTAGDADVERALTILREQQARYEDVQRPLQDGDVAVVTYTGTSEGQPLTAIAPSAQGLTHKENTWMLVKPESFVPGFTDPLVGAGVGDKRTANVTFPADFVHPELSGKPAVYEIEVLGVKQKLLPEVNEAFAAQFGASSLDELLQGIRRDLQREMDGRQKTAIRDQLIKQLLAQVEVELPESVVANETRRLVYDIVNENQQRRVPKEVIEQKRDEIFQNASVAAKDRVKSAFILNRIAEEEKIGITDRELSQRVVQLAQQNNTTPEKMVKAIQERNAVGEVRQDVLTSKVLEFLELNAQIEDVLPTQPDAAPAPTA